jgi:hypothetical protein
MRSEVYKEIRARLLTGIANLQYVDLQKGQMSNKAQNYPIPLPAVLVEFGQVSWSNSTGGQLGDSVISAYLYIDHVTDSFDGAELENETISLLDGIDEVHKILQGLWGTNFSPLSRISDYIVEWRDRYLCMRTDFRTTLFCENQSSNQKHKIENIKININGKKGNE